MPVIDFYVLQNTAPYSVISLHTSLISLHYSISLRSSVISLYSVLKGG